MSVLVGVPLIYWTRPIKRLFKFLLIFIKLNIPVRICLENNYWFVSFSHATLRKYFHIVKLSAPHNGERK